MRYTVVVAFLILAGGLASAGYDYVIEDGYSGGLILEDSATLLMTGGGVHEITLYDNTQALIQGTSPLGEFTGGIWDFTMAGYSQLEFSGGGIHEFTIGSYATASFSGGRIDEIRSYQAAYTHAGWPNPHIEMVCDIDTVDHNIATNMLTGNWLDGSGFEIQLVDIAGYDPVIENIQFIPEPATLLLMGAATLLMRKRR